MRPSIVTQAAADNPISRGILHRLIFVSGVRPCGYTLHLSSFDGMQDLPFNKYEVALRVCQTMREYAAVRQDWFPLQVHAVRGNHQALAPTS